MFEHSRDTFYVSDGISFSNLRFENDVEMYGAQAGFCCSITFDVFENDVEMYGAQATLSIFGKLEVFENDVEMYGAQAVDVLKKHKVRLRMM